VFTGIRENPEGCTCELLARQCDRLAGVVELPDLHGAFIEIVEQACIDAHLAEVFPKRLPVGSAAAGTARNPSITRSVG
jgi:hypothetical protein